MKTTVRKTIMLTRPELIEAVRKYANVPDDHTLDGFTVKEAAMAEPEPVVWLVVIEPEES